MADVLPDRGCACARDRRWCSGTRRCEACGCAYVACGISASPQGTACARMFGHRGDHLTTNGDQIKVRKR